MRPSTRRARPGRRVALLAIGVLVVAACGSSSTGDDPTTASGSAESVIDTLLSTVAYPEQGLTYLSATDYQGAFEVVGADRTTLCEGDAWSSAMADVRAEIGVGPSLLLSNGTEGAADMREAFGVHFCDVAGTVDFEGVRVAIGEIDADAVVAAASADDRWADRLEVTEVGDATVLDWSADGFTFDRPPSPMFNTYLDGGALAVKGNLLVRGQAVDAATHATGDGATLAETGSIGTTGGLLIERGALSLTISTRPYAALPDLLVGFPPDDLDTLIEDLETAIEATRVGLPLWTSMGFASAVDDTGAPVGLVAFTFTTADDAATGAAVFEASITEGLDLPDGVPWSDRLAIEDVEVDDRSFVATLTAVNPEESAFLILNFAWSTLSPLFAIGEAPEE